MRKYFRTFGLLLVFFINFTATYSYAASPYCRDGDLNKDGSINCTDIAILEDCIYNRKPRAECLKLYLDINFDFKIDSNDVLSLVKCSKGSCIGDANMDGVFDSNDLIHIFENNQHKYETGELAGWCEGNWNGDYYFDSQDLLVALKEGCYEGELEY